MTKNNEKNSQSPQLLFEFSTAPQSGEIEVCKSLGVVTHFVSRESVATRREAIERVRRDGIFTVSRKTKA